MTSYRVPSSGLVDRGTSLAFTFDGKRLQGLGGDTLASALLANDQMLVGRSFKYHRPRGIVTAGSAEPNALVTIGKEGRTEPNTRATVAELHASSPGKSRVTNTSTSAGMPMTPATRVATTSAGPCSACQRSRSVHPATAAIAVSTGPRGSPRDAKPAPKPPPATAHQPAYRVVTARVSVVTARNTSRRLSETFTGVPG